MQTHGMQYISMIVVESILTLNEVAKTVNIYA